MLETTSEAQHLYLIGTTSTKDKVSVWVQREAEVNV